MITTVGQNRVAWFARASAFAVGVIRCWLGISVAADTGEMLMAALFLFCGAGGIAFAATGRLPTRVRRAGSRRAPPDER